MGERTYYLDHAAATPCDPRVIAAMQPFLTDVFYNPSASYRGGRDAKAALEQAREEIALVLGAKANDCIFTAGATESINLAISGVLAGGGHAVISGVEHVAVYEAVRNHSHTVAAVDHTGLVLLDSLRESITDETTLVSVVLADNEFGTIQPIADVARIVAEVREGRRNRGVSTPLYLHSDGSQGALSLDLKVSRLGVDLLTLSAGKCYGPKQVGLLWHKSSVRLTPLLHGGKQERGLRSGTENVAGAAGFAQALRMGQSARHRENERLQAMRNECIERLTAAIPDLVIDGHPKRHLPGHIHMHVDGLDAERVVFHLDNEGIYIATGAACSANKAVRVPSLSAVGLSETEADGSLRITMGHLNEAQDIPYLAEHVADAIRTERQL